MSIHNLDLQLSSDFRKTAAEWDPVQQNWSEEAVRGLVMLLNNVVSVWRIFSDI